MARASNKAASKKRISTKSDVIMKAKATTTRIVDINNEIVRPKLKPTFQKILDDIKAKKEDLERS